MPQPWGNINDLGGNREEEERGNQRERDRGGIGHALLQHQCQEERGEGEAIIASEEEW